VTRQHLLEQRRASAHDQIVFLNGKRRPWTRQALCTKWYRLRKLLGLPTDCKLYGTRHAFITRGVKNNTSLKALATLAGHSTTAMIERVYCHVCDDYDFLHAAAVQAIGQGGVGNGAVKKGRSERRSTVRAGTAAQPPDCHAGTQGRGARAERSGAEADDVLRLR
jgi:hypothetical protein